MKHFLKKGILFTSIFLSGGVVGGYVDNWLDIDTCLDSGGAWNYAQEYCQRQ